MSKPYVVGVDVGGTNTVFGIVNSGGQILYRGSMKTLTDDKVETFVDNLYETLWPIIMEAGGPLNIVGIGVGAPDANYFTGLMENPSNLPWGSFVPLVRLIRDRFNIPTVITNDANAAAQGEMTYGVAREMRDFIMITLGTGVGSGIVVNGEVVLGSDGFAGELGHVIMRRENGRPCGCGRSGCLEAYASATGVSRTAKELLENSDAPSLLREVDINTITSKDVHEAAKQGDAIALQIFEETGKILGEAFADFVAFSSPEAIVLFGGLTKAGEYIRRPIKEHMEANMLANYKNKVKILFSELKESDAAVLGASALGWKASEWIPTPNK